MELKFEDFKEHRIIVRVLIVPLWNWNKSGYFQGTDTSRFNRTFMELKYGSLAAASSVNPGFNRTFMELKSNSGERLGSYAGF